MQRVYLSLVLLSFSLCVSAAQSRVVNLCVDPDWLPYEKLDEKGRHIGLVSEYMNLFQSRSRLEFKLVKTKSWEETQNLYRKGECDIVSALNKTPERSQHLVFTNAYIKSPAVLVLKHNNTMVSKLKDLNGKTLGMVKGYVYEEKLKADYPQIKIIYLANMETALHKVSSGEIEATLGPLFLAFTLTQQGGIDNLKIQGKTGYSDELRIGINKNNAPLAKTLSNVVSGLTADDHANVRRSWSMNRNR